MRTIAPLLILLLAGTVLAADDPKNNPKKHDPRAAFAETDTNHDGAIDHQEFHARIVEVFYMADTNRDGYLDETELTALAYPDDFKEHDKDANGRVSLREFLRVRWEGFEEADTNEDETLSVEEVVAVFERKDK